MVSRFFIGLSLLASSLSAGSVHADSLGYDGCYQLYRPGSLFPVLCVAGTLEEGINGSGVRAVLVGPNSPKVVWCGMSKSMDLGDFSPETNRVKLFFPESAGIRSIEFHGSVEASGREGGHVSITEGRSELRLEYVKLPDSFLSSDPALRVAFDSDSCRAARTY